MKLNFINESDWNKFDETGKLMFIPPDSTFKLMEYGSCKILETPFSVEWIKEIDEKEYGYLVIVKSKIRKRLENVEISIPIDSTATNIKLRMTKGIALYEPENDWIKWKINNLNFGVYSALRITLNFSVQQKRISHPKTIKANVSIPYYSLLGVNFQNVKVREKYDYDYEYFIQNKTDLLLTFYQNY